MECKLYCEKGYKQISNLDSLEHYLVPTVPSLSNYMVLTFYYKNHFSSSLNSFSYIFETEYSNPDEIMPLIHIRAQIFSVPFLIFPNIVYFLDSQYTFSFSYTQQIQILSSHPPLKSVFTSNNPW